MTMHPLIGSPAIDAAGSTNPGGTDQRGLPRFVDGDGDGIARLDIGSVEAGPLATPVVFATYPVTTAADEDNGGINPLFGAGTSLREAIKYAPEGSVISFASGLSGATISLTPALGEIVAGKTLFIDASNLSSPVTISGNNASRVFNIAAGATVAMHSLKIVNGRAPDGADNLSGSAENGASGGGILNAGTLSLFSSTLADHRAGNGGNGLSGGYGGDGGGISNNGTLALRACTLSGCAAGDGRDVVGFDGNGGSGGGIYSNGPLTLTACTVSGCSAGNGGGSGFSGRGGAIEQVGNAVCRLNACTIAGNRTGAGSPVGGGGLSTTFVVLQHCVIAGNTIGTTTTLSDVLAFRITYVGANLLSFGATASQPTGPRRSSPIPFSVRSATTAAPPSPCCPHPLPPPSTPPPVPPPRPTSAACR